jgi:hypothetical protein
MRKERVVKPCQNSGMEVSSNELRKAVESQHGRTATLVTKLPVTEVFEGKRVWDGVVHIFNLDGNAKATRAYAWSSPVQGSDKRLFYAVLHLGSVRSPLDAVRATIVAEQRIRTQ